MFKFINGMIDDMTNQSLNIFISAGEISGDLHAAELVKSLKNRLPQARFFGMGDSAMAAAGVDLLATIHDHSAIGMWQSIREVTRVRQTTRELIAMIKTHQPDYIIVVDCEAIHVPVLRAVRALNIPNSYYISPQLWWTRNQNDQHQIATRVMAVTDHILAIFKPEEELYTKLGHPSVHYVGHPLLDIARATQSKAAVCAALGVPMNQPLIGIFPGSRWQEIKSTYPRLIQAAQAVVARGVQAHIVVVLRSKKYANYIRANTPESIPIHMGDSYAVMPHLSASLVLSGTVTLEHALFQVPMVVVYRFGPLITLFIRLWLQVKSIELKWVSLPNLIMQKTVVPECLQRQATVPNLAHALYQLCDPQYPVDNNPYRQRQQQGFAAIKAEMGPAGAVDRAAGLIEAWCRLRYG